MKFDRLVVVTVPPRELVGRPTGDPSRVRGRVGPADWMSSLRKFTDLTSDF